VVRADRSTAIVRNASRMARSMANGRATVNGIFSSFVAVRDIGEGQALRKRDTRDSLNSLLESRAECEQIGLNLSIIALDRIVVALKEAKTDWATINQSADELHERIQDELDTILFMHIPTERAEFYRAPFKRWGDAINRFPKTLNDVEEAGKCLACARGTACVFHLMRIMETALRTLANDLGIPYAPNWESYLAG